MKLVYSAAERKARDLDEEALGWLVRLTSGEESPEEHDAFRRWRDQSAEHAAALHRARTLWQQLGTAVPEVERRRNRSADRVRRVARMLPIAAALLLCVFTGERYWTNWRFDQVTATGERRVVTLADGSRITMAPDTAFTVDTSAHARRIVLARGEALFEVRHDASRPFVVRIGQTEFRDVGTIFDLRHAGNTTRLVVTQGLVEASRDDRRLLVSAGQGLEIDQAIGAVHAVDAARETSWTNGRMTFHDRPLSEIIAAVAPYYQGRIFLVGRDVGNVRLDASVDLDHVDDWLVTLEQIKRANVTRLGPVTILS